MKKYIDTGKKDTRSGFGDGLTELGKSNKNVVALCADLIGSLKMDDFKKNHPEVIRGQISEYFKDDQKMSKISKYLMKSLFFNRFTKPDFVSYGIYDIPNKYLDKLMKKGLTVISYAARSQKDLDFVKSHYHNSVFEFFEPKK